MSKNLSRSGEYSCKYSAMFHRNDGQGPLIQQFWTIFQWQYKSEIVKENLRFTVQIVGMFSRE